MGDSDNTISDLFIDVVSNCFHIARSQIMTEKMVLCRAPSKDYLETEKMVLCRAPSKDYLEKNISGLQ